MSVDERKQSGIIVSCLQGAIFQGAAGLDDVPSLVKRILSEKRWQEREIPQTRGVQTFTRFAEFVTTPPVEGLGTTVKTLRRLCADDPEAAALLEKELTVEPGGNNNPEGIGGKSHKIVIVDIINNDNGRDSPTGTNAAYALRRLRKDAPEVYEEVSRGALTPHAGMIKAGLRPKMRSIPADDPVQAARSLARAFDTDQLLQLIDELTRYLVGPSEGLDTL